MQHLKSRIFIGGGMAVALIVSGAVVANLAAKPKAAPAPVLHASQPLPPPAPAAEPAAPVAEPVLYKNPFDRSEVFEFPAGTTNQEARDAVAKLLMDRTTRWPYGKHWARRILGDAKYHQYKLAQQFRGAIDYWRSARAGASGGLSS